MICDTCGDEFRPDPENLDLDDPKALRTELAESVNSVNRITGLYADDPHERIRAVSRVAWLASRVAWLESADLRTAAQYAELEAHGLRP